MPYLCTHLAFGDRAAKAFGRSIESMGSGYALGCLGPDIYFFDRLPPTPFVPHRKKHGNALHALDCAVLFDALADCASEEEQPYLYGFLTHIALDSTLHPYVEAHHSGPDHTRFEGVIDSIVYAQTRNRIDYRAILSKPVDASGIDALLTKASARFVPTDVHGAYVRSLRKFHRIFPLLFDPEGKRFRPILKAERLIRKEGLLSAFLLAAPRGDERDAMNLQHRAWTDPFRKGGVHTDSVPELFDRASVLAENLFFAYRDGDTDTLNALLSDRTMQKGALK